MSAAKIAVSIDRTLLTDVDELVKKGAFASRSQAVQEALREKLARQKRTRLARESAKLSRAFEKALAEEGLSLEIAGWPEY
ncbi:MAG: ribbon-helix-helix domain-containing protein [Acidithiobacillales bacterium]